MKVYSSWVPSNSLCGIFRDLGFGVLFTPRARRYPQDGIPWVLDNGAYRAWSKKERFDPYAFLRALRIIPSHRKPDFVVIPDIVAGGRESLAFSRMWINRISPALRRYLAVQDGMEPQDVIPFMDDGTVNGIFVGGSLDWKLTTGKDWVAFAHDHGRPAHIGRCGPLDRIVWAKTIGADSIDSGTWARRNREAALRRVAQVIA